MRIHVHMYVYVQYMTTVLCYVHALLLKHTISIRYNGVPCRLQCTVCSMYVHPYSCRFPLHSLLCSMNTTIHTIMVAFSLIGGTTNAR